MNIKFLKIIAILIAVSTLILLIYFVETQHAASLQDNPAVPTQTKPSSNTLEIITQFNRMLFAGASEAVVIIKSQGTKKSDPSGAGTGFIISAEGYILTAIENVEQDEKAAEITFVNGRKAKADFVGCDELNACALLKLTVPMDNLKYLKFGDSRKLNLGDAVFVLANAFSDYEKTNAPTFSKGEITGFYRSSKKSLETINWAKRFNTIYKGVVIEISCAVNEGSFGAPVLNSAGEIVGIVSRVLDVNRWLGTAIPAHQVVANLENLKQNKKNAGAKINFEIEDIANDANKGYVKITKINEGAAYNNLKVGDIIKIFDCDELTTGKAQFDEILQTLPTQSRIYFTLLREGKILRTVEYLE